MKESELQALIVSALRFKGYLVYMNYQNITFSSFREGGALKNVHAMNASLAKTGWVKGIPDLTVIGKESNGNYIRLYIECKSETGTVSADQKHMIKILKVLGQEVRVVRDISQIQDLLDKDMINVESLLKELQIEEDRIKQENEMLKAKKKEDEKLAKELVKQENEILKAEKKENEKLAKELVKQEKKLAKALEKAEKKAQNKKIQKK